ncbi:MAG: (Fe-S)-binding protein [Deltaproteobacteria bacterium]|nr:(Fe-S)-binding protein [Deltaproteobacteria bacterium]
MDKMKGHDLLREAGNRVGRCDRCGTCLPVCPLFGVKGIEATSARGKNAVTRALAAGGIAPSREALDVVNFCLLCRACVDTCPAKVPTDEAMVDIRQHLTDLTGGPSVKYRLVGNVLKRPWVVKAGAAALSILRKTGLAGLFPYGMAPEEYTRDHFLTAFAGPAALGRPVPPSGVPVTGKSRVAVFKGCGMEMMFPEAAAQTRKLLATTTASLLVKPNVCCGLPHLAHGLRGEFLALARKNIGIFADTDIVVSDCASCGATLKHLGAFFADDPEWKERAEAFSAKVMDLTEYLARAGYQPRQKADALFTYHDPCHLVRGQGIVKPPRELLKAAGKFVEMKGADVCCGGAGSFHIDYPEAAAQILEKKRLSIEQTGAKVVVTGCPGCLIQLSKAAKASGGKFKAMHISQVI